MIFSYELILESKSPAPAHTCSGARADCPAHSPRIYGLYLRTTLLHKPPLAWDGPVSGSRRDILHTFGFVSLIHNFVIVITISTIYSDFRNLKQNIDESLGKSKYNFEECYSRFWLNELKTMEWKCTYRAPELRSRWDIGVCLCVYVCTKGVTKSLDNYVLDMHIKGFFFVCIGTCCFIFTYFFILLWSH